MADIWDRVFGESPGKKKNNAAVAKARAGNRAESERLARAAKATARAKRAAAAKGGGTKHRPAGSPRGGQFF